MSIYAVFLDGWDHRSTWGWDDGMGCFYAQLTRNGESDANGPGIWITPPTWPQATTATQLATLIAAATGADLHAVQVAMNEGLDGDSDVHPHRVRLAADDGTGPRGGAGLRDAPGVDLRGSVDLRDRQDAQHPVAQVVADVAVTEAERLMRESGMMPPPTAHMFMEDQEPGYVGYVTTRPFARGADAAQAISRLGELPSALYVTRLLLIWEHADIYTALGMPGAPYPTALVTLEATFTAHTLTWRPFTITWGPIGTLGFPTVIPTWLPQTTHGDGQLPEPIRAAIDRWRQLGHGDIEPVIAALQRDQFQVSLIALA